MHELVENYDGLLEKSESCMSRAGVDGEVCGIIYLTARTGERVGSKAGSASETYRYEKGENGKPKRIVTCRIPTFGISTLRARHVKVDRGHSIPELYGEKKMHSYAVKRAAEFLGNKPTVLKKSYANPADFRPRVG